MVARASGKALVEIARRLGDGVGKLEFGPPVTHVYNPLDYAWEPHTRYLERFGGPGKDAIFLGMNPGPWGMAQTGVPFGEIGLVRDWLGIDGEVGKPAREHPKRPIEGFACDRSEVSGRRIWGWAKRRFGVPERFFERFFVANYCPLSFLEESGRNRTPDKLPVAERAPLLELCDEALARTVAALEPRWVIGVGAFAEGRARAALGGGDGDGDVSIGRILHPSPASPAANRDWEGTAERQLKNLGLL